MHNNEEHQRQTHHSKPRYIKKSPFSKMSVKRDAAQLLVEIARIKREICEWICKSANIYAKAALIFTPLLYTWTLMCIRNTDLALIRQRANMRLNPPHLCYFVLEALRPQAAYEKQYRHDKYNAQSVHYRHANLHGC